MVGVTIFAELVLVSGLPFLCPSGTRPAGFWRNSGFVLSGAEQRSFSVFCCRGLEDMYKAVKARCSLSGAEQKSSHSIAVGVSRTCTRLTRRVVSQSPRFACLHI